MAKQDINIIHRANIVVEVPNEKMGRQLYGNVSDIFNRLVLPELEKIFAKYNMTEDTIRFDALDIDLKFSSKEILSEQLLKSAIVQKIERRLQNVLKHKDETKQNADTPYFSDEYQKTIEGFIFFLSTGRLPWFFVTGEPIDSTEKIIEAVNRHEDFFIERFDDLIKEDKSVLRKINAQYNLVLVEYIISLYVTAQEFSVFADDKKMLRSYFSELYHAEEVLQMETEWVLGVCAALLSNGFSPQKNLITFSQNKANEIISYFENENNEQAKNITKVKEIIASFIESDIAQQQEDGKEESAEQKIADNRQSKQEEKTEALYYSNAGLILLHPFLQYFFMEFSLLDKDNSFKDEQAQETAVHLLHYLATFKENAPDYELTFAKYFCGMSLTHITQRQTAITDKMKTESEDLLKSVIKHWSALKNTTPQGLQDTFLQRKGKLITGNNSDKLILEYNTTDILLERLPWSISIIKLPWLKNMIYTEWNS